MGDRDVLYLSLYVSERELLAMAERKFKIGQVVYFRPKRTSTPLSSPPGPYQIMRLLPATEGEYQYVIRSANDDHERVAKESELSRF
jgi:hypothetical protein